MLARRRRHRLEGPDPAPFKMGFTGIADRTGRNEGLMPMPTRQQFCAIDDLAALQGQPAASLILGSLLLLTRP